MSNWHTPLAEADGLSFSLYDHKVGSTGRHGDPNADVYAVVARPNNAILVVADGCSWGPKPRQAARCAARGSMEYLNRKLFDRANAVRDTQDVVRAVLLSFHSAQRMIVENDGATTTLCVAVVCELAEPRGEHRWGLCVVSVGDSPCFVWQSKTGQVFEVTSAAHDGRVRDMRDSGGCLGTSTGQEPDLNNLVCCFTTMGERDIVFLTSDGVSDNFDPITRMEGTTQEAKQVKKPEGAAQSISSTCNLPVLTTSQRQSTLLSNISGLLSTLRPKASKQELSAWEVNDAVIKYVIEITDSKRQYMEETLQDIERPGCDKAEKNAKEMDFRMRLKTFKGKLDHATIVTYKVPHLDGGFYTHTTAPQPYTSQDEQLPLQAPTGAVSHCQTNSDVATSIHPFAVSSSKDGELMSCHIDNQSDACHLKE